MSSYFNLNLKGFFKILKSKRINPSIVKTFRNTFYEDLNKKTKLYNFNLTISNSQIEVICDKYDEDYPVTIYVLVENIDSTNLLFNFETCYGENWHLQHMYN